jgi:hypothetical protein
VFTLHLGLNDTGVKGATHRAGKIVVHGLREQRVSEAKEASIRLDHQPAAEEPFERPVDFALLKTGHLGSEIRPEASPQNARAARALHARRVKSGEAGQD